jgi:hypothetical protein
MAVDIEQIYAPVRNACPGVTAPAMEIELYSVLDEFFSETSLWVEEVDFETEAEVKEYTVTPADGVIIRLMNVVDENENPVGASFMLPDTLKLNVEPTGGDTLTVNVALKPNATEDVDRCAPEWIYSMYADVLADGLKARLMAQPAKPYSNPALAGFHQRKFNAAKASIRAENLQKFTFRGTGWRFPRFGR